MGIEKPYQPSAEEMKKAQEMADVIQNKRGENIMTEEQKKMSEEREEIFKVGRRKGQEETYNQRFNTVEGRERMATVEAGRKEGVKVRTDLLEKEAKIGKLLHERLKIGHTYYIESSLNNNTYLVRIDSISEYGLSGQGLDRPVKYESFSYSTIMRITTEDGVLMLSEEETEEAKKVWSKDLIG